MIKRRRAAAVAALLWLGACGTPFGPPKDSPDPVRDQLALMRTDLASIETEFATWLLSPGNPTPPKDVLVQVRQGFVAAHEALNRAESAHETSETLDSNVLKALSAAEEALRFAASLIHQIDPTLGGR